MSDFDMLWQFDPDIRAWRKEFKQQYGEEPQIEGSDYDYKTAVLSGLRPTAYAPDGGKYHWPSSTDDGTMLKAKNHPTAWMENYMQKFGVDPNVDDPKRVQQYLIDNNAVDYLGSLMK